MIGSLRGRATSCGDAERLVQATRERFGLGDDDAVLAVEVACSLPGCPPLETAIAFWACGVRHQFKLFKPMRDVVADDLPHRWLKDSLAAPDGSVDSCC